MLNFKPFQTLKPKQWWWLWSAYWRLWPVLLRIKFRQGEWLRRKISLNDARRLNLEPPPERHTDAVRLHESIRLAARLHFLKADCLPKSIVLADMLVRRSQSAKVFIGVIKTKAGIASHAWVELDGVMLAEPESVESDFTVLSD